MRSNLVEIYKKVTQQILYLKDENIDKDLKPIIKSLRKDYN